MQYKIKTITKLRQPIKLRVIQRIWSVFKADFNQNSKISAQELKEVGRDELTGVNLGQVDPATLQATKIACGAHMCGLVRCNYFRV